MTLPPPAPRVALLTPDTPEQQALLRWVAAEDPALVAASAGTEPAALLHFPYHPSYEALRTPPRLPPEEPVRPEPPPSPISLAPSIAAGARRAAPAPPRARRPPRPCSSAAASPAGPSPPAARRSCTRAPRSGRVQFLLALTDRGEPRFTFLQRSSGDEAADAAGGRAGSPAPSFSRAETPLAWGIATVVWGDDVYALRRRVPRNDPGQPQRPRGHFPRA